MKPIEPGCKAIIVNTGKGYERYIGTIVNVCILYGFESGQRNWEISCPAWKENKLILERDIVRIDDDANLQLENHDKELVHD